MKRMTLVLVALLGAVVLSGLCAGVLSAAADAQVPTTDTCYGGCPPTTQVEPSSNPPRTTDPGVTTTTSSSTTSSGSTLPFTGADVAGTALIGVVLLGAGIGLFVSARRRDTAAN